MSIEVHVRLRPNVPSPVWSSAETVLYSTVNPNTRYVYNKVHSPSSTNHNIFQALEPIVHAAFDGKNVTIMAYGQTGSGKTHSMIGTPDDAGVVPRTARLLLALKASVPAVRLFAYYTEIYNESVKDLLEPQRGELALHDAADGSVYFDKRTVELHTMDDFLQLHAMAERNRKYGVTNLNDHSSRSHIVLTIEVHRGCVSGSDRGGNDSGGSASMRSVVNLVDLAGSESASRANTDGGTLREGGFINRSLLALGNVVDAIVERRAYVPYRDAKLTRLLRSCLGGTGITFILCCVNPARDNVDQTIATLRFTQRAMKITKDPVVVLALPPLFTHQYAHAARQLRDGVEQACAAAYERGVRDTYVYALSTTTAVATSLQAHVHDALQALTSTQRLLVAHDTACAARQLGEQQRQLDETTRQRADAEARAASERKRRQRSEDEVAQRRAKLARLEADVRTRRAADDAAVAEWEFALHAAQQQHVPEEALLLRAEECARVQLELDWALSLERIVSRGVPTLQSLLASRMHALLLSSSSAAAVARRGDATSEATTTTTQHNNNNNNDDTTTTQHNGNDDTTTTQHVDAADATAIVSSVPATPQGLLELHRRLTRAQAELADLETAHAMVRDDLAAAAVATDDDHHHHNNNNNNEQATTVTGRRGGDDDDTRAAAVVEERLAQLAREERQLTASARRAAHMATLRTLRDSLARGADADATQRPQRRSASSKVVATGGVGGGSASPAQLTTRDKRPQLRVHASSSNTAQQPQQLPSPASPSRLRDDDGDRYAVGVRNALSVLDQLRCRLMQNTRPADNNSNSKDDSKNNNDDDDGSTMMVAARRAARHKRRDGATASRSRSRTPTHARSGSSRSTSRARSTRTRSVTRAQHRQTSQAATTGHDMDAHERRGHIAVSPPPPSQQQQQQQQTSQQQQQQLQHTNNNNDDDDNVPLLELYHRRQQLRPRRVAADDDSAGKENSVAAAVAAQWAAQRQRSAGGSSSDARGYLSNTNKAATLPSQSRAASKTRSGGGGVEDDDVVFATRSSDVNGRGNDTSDGAAAAVERVLWRLHANSQSPSLSRRDGRSRSRRCA